MNSRAEILTAFSVILTCWFLSVASVAAQPAPGESDQSRKQGTNHHLQRTHAIDEFPSFDLPSESASKTVERTAEEQIKQSSQEDEHLLEPRTAGKVIVTTEQKKESAKDSTKIDKQHADDTTALPQAESKRPTVALALGGGGARGAAHIGVLRVFQQEGIPVDFIVGNSMGSIVGGLYCAGVPLDDISRMLKDGSLHKAYIPGFIPPTVLMIPFEKLLHPFCKHYAGLWSGKKFGDFLERQLPKGVENVEDTPIPFSAVVTNLVDGKAYRISDGKLSTAIRASSTLSPILQPVAIEDKVYMDGGVRANLPCSGARDTGANIVIGVLVDEPLRKLPVTRFRHVKGIANRLADVMLATADQRQLQFADIIINPDVSGITLSNVSRENVEKAIAAGEAAARKALPAIRKRLKEPIRTKGDSAAQQGASSE